MRSDWLTWIKVSYTSFQNLYFNSFSRISSCEEQFLFVPVKQKLLVKYLHGTNHHIIIALCYGSLTCPNGGTCEFPNRCQCRPGYTGPRCAGMLHWYEMINLSTSSYVVMCFMFLKIFAADKLEFRPFEIRLCT